MAHDGGGVRGWVIGLCRLQTPSLVYDILTPRRKVPQSDARSACRLVRFGHQCSEDVCDKVAGRFRHDNLNRGGRGKGGHRIATGQDHFATTDKSRPLCDHRQDHFATTDKITCRPQISQDHFVTTNKSRSLCDHRHIKATL